jgi:hypothetical protein
MKDIKNKYSQLRKKYHLPKLEELTREFAIKLENPDLILHDIIYKINEEISDCAKTLESIIFIGSSGEPSFLYEANMLKNKREKIFILYKKLMSLVWEGRKVLTAASEEDMARFINESYNNWIQTPKKEFIGICEIFEKKWKEVKLRESSTSLMYHG